MNKNILQITISLFLILFGQSYSQEKTKKELNNSYGNNENIGEFVKINGSRIYYEEYGKGEPLLLIHGNGGSIKSMKNQIAYFKTKYRVIIADNRGQGKSEMKTDSLTYTQIAKDWEGLVNYLKLDSINIVGWSDGGIIGLKMGVSSKVKIKKIVAMGANLRPDSTAVHSWAINEVRRLNKVISDKIINNDTTQDWKLHKQLVGLLMNQPNIPTNDLSKINAKVLIVAGDKDIIKNRHSIEIFENIPNAHLCIMPGETHWTPETNAELFNSIVDKFISEPYKRPDSNWTKKQKK